MALKLFAKTSEVEVSEIVSNTQDARIVRLEKTVEDMTQQMSHMKNEVDTMIARQQGFRLALRRLREYLEERGVQERSSTEKKDDQSASATIQQAIARKDRSGMH